MEKFYDGILSKYYCNEKEIIHETIDISNKAFAPLTNFLVGAILETKEGKLYSGVNVETPSALFCLCAERTAFVKAISCGERSFKRIYIYGHKEGKDATRCIPPCGMCRQLITELCDADFEIVMIKSKDDFERHTLEELVPFSFAKKLK